MIPQLPEPVEEVTIPDHFSPSTLSIATECPLRCVLSSGRISVPRLPTHPAAERGSVFHKLLDSAGKGSIQRVASARDSVEAELERLLIHTHAKLAQNPDTAHFADLRSTLSIVEWHNKTRDMLLTAERLLEMAPLLLHQAHTRGSGPVDFNDLNEAGSYHEVNIKSDQLRLSGRMDLVELEGHKRVAVSDYKTGRVLDRRGDVQEHIALQLRLYALAVERSDPSADVEIYVTEGASRRRVDWNPDVRSRTEETLQSILDELPARATSKSEDLARPGPWCASCRFRFVCRGYLSFAPPTWLTGCESGPLPLDIWGRSRGCQRTISGLALDVTDAANRNVRIQRIDLRHGTTDDFVVGRDIYLFGLATIQRSHHHARHFHPRNFFELPGDRLGTRAWSLAVYCMPRRGTR